MSDHLDSAHNRRPATTPRRLWLWLLGLVVVTLAASLAIDFFELATDPWRHPWAIGRDTLWAVVALGLIAGCLVALALRPRWRRVGTASGVALAMLVSGTGAFLAIPAIAIEAPPCGPADPALGDWHVEARTSVDSIPRDSLALDFVPIDRTADPLLSGLLRDLAPTAVEDLGIEIVDGDSLYARHCRALVSGSQATSALPLLANGAGMGASPLVPADLPVWRGDFEWWLSWDGDLVRATFRVGGHPNDAWPEVDGNWGLLMVDAWSIAMVGRR